MIVSGIPGEPHTYTVDAYSVLASDCNSADFDLLYLSTCDPDILGTDSLSDPSFPYDLCYPTYKPNYDSFELAPLSLHSIPIFSIHSHVLNPTSPVPFSISSPANDTFLVPSSTVYPIDPVFRYDSTHFQVHADSNALCSATPTYLSSKKKYKPVAKKVKPVLAPLPDNFRIHRNIVGDPLATMQPLSPHPPDFVPTGRYTTERKQIIDELHGDFLWPEERKLLHQLYMQHDRAFAWTDSERGSF